MSKKKVKPLKMKTKKIDDDLNKAYKKNLGNKHSEGNTINNIDVLEEDEVQTEVEQETVEKEDYATNKQESKSLEELQEENNKLKELLARKSAELDNIIKRTLKEKNDLIDYGNEALLLKFLPLLDDFSKAIEAAKNSTDYDSLLKGIEMIHEKTIKTFNDAGVKKIDVKPGDDFDVNFHEAILQMPSEDYEEGKIVQIAEDGYLLKDKVIRHAKVITSSGKQNN